MLPVHARTGACATLAVPHCGLCLPTLVVSKRCFHRRSRRSQRLFSEHCGTSNRQRAARVAWCQSRALALDADALRGAGSSLGDPCHGAMEGETWSTDRWRLLFTGHPGPRPIAWPHQLLKPIARRPKRQLAQAPLPPARAPLTNSCGQQKNREDGRALLIYPAPARERVRSSRRYLARAGRFFCSARRWMPRAGPLGGRNVCGARDTRK